MTRSTLTPAQQRVLDAAPFSITTFGLKIMAGSPYKGFRQDTAYALVKAGLLKISKPMAFEVLFTRVEK
jgi:hypothetical protein